MPQPVLSAFVNLATFFLYFKIHLLLSHRASSVWHWLYSQPREMEGELRAAVTTANWMPAHVSPHVLTKPASRGICTARLPVP